MTNYDNVPEELKHLKRWVNCDESKIPLCPFENRPASASDMTTWGSFEEAIWNYDHNIHDYCGFVFSGDGYIGIDIDSGYDSDGFITELGADIIDHCKSYTEKSRSGRGFHIILKGTLPFKGKNNLTGVEIYQTSRFFIMTGEVVLYSAIRANQQAIDYILEKYFPNMRESSANFDKCRIYSPDWSNPTDGTRIRLRPVYPKIPNGSRNICLTSLAGMLHNQGYSKDQIKNELLYANLSACEPPLDEYEIDTICNSVTRYKR